MTERHTQRAELIRRALLNVAPQLQPKFQEQTLVSLDTGDARCDRAIKDYLEQSFIDQPVLPDGEKGELRFADLPIEDDSKEQMVRDEADLTEYLHYHLLMQRLTKALSGSSSEATLPHLLSTPEERTMYGLPAMQMNNMQWESFWRYLGDSQAIGKSQIRAYAENRYDEAVPYRSDLGPCFITLSSEACTTLLELNDDSFSFAVKQAQEKALAKQRRSI